MATMVDRLERARAARRELEAALRERDAAQHRFEAAIGTSMEMSAYLRLRRATRGLAAMDAELGSLRATVPDGQAAVPGT